MRRDENWAIDIARIHAFFREQPDVQEEQDCFRFGKCIITLIPHSASAMGKWEIPRTQVIIEGTEDDIQIIHRRFFLRFLSAGG